MEKTNPKNCTSCIGIHGRYHSFLTCLWLGSTKNNEAQMLNSITNLPWKMVFMHGYSTNAKEIWQPRVNRKFSKHIQELHQDIDKSCESWFMVYCETHVVRSPYQGSVILRACALYLKNWNSHKKYAYKINIAFIKLWDKLHTRQTSPHNIAYWSNLPQQLGFEPGTFKPKANRLIRIQDNMNKCD